MLYKLFKVILVMPLVLMLMDSSSVEAKSRTHPIYTPEPINTKGVTTTKVKKGIRKALFKRDWKMKEPRKGLIRATYTKPGRGGRTHKAVVDVSYGGGIIKIKYHDSTDLNYDAEKKVIHGTYNRWVKNIEKDIRLELDLF